MIIKIPPRLRREPTGGAAAPTRGFPDRAAGPRRIPTAPGRMDGA